MIRIDPLGLIVGIVTGIIALYTNVSPSETIIVFPTPSNSSKVQYIDKAGVCYLYNKRYTPCTKDARTTPIQ